MRQDDHGTALKEAEEVRKAAIQQAAGQLQTDALVTALKETEDGRLTSAQRAARDLEKKLQASAIKKGFKIILKPDTDEDFEDELSADPNRRFTSGSQAVEVAPIAGVTVLGVKVNDGE